MTIDVGRNVHQFLQGGGKQLGTSADWGYVSFDYCYTYFHAFREGGEVENMVAPDNLFSSINLPSAPEAVLQIAASIWILREQRRCTSGRHYPANRVVLN